jgi:DNA-binding MarR family transcriptional regulator
MMSPEGNPLVIQTLADFRYELRRFNQFSEQAAQRQGVQTKQYQLLLQVAGAPREARVTIAYAAERMGLKHNSMVELVDRSEKQGLLARGDDPDDRRRTLLRVTRKGQQLLSRLADEHARELTERAPRMISALEHLRRHAQKEAE